MQLVSNNFERTRVQCDNKSGGGWFLLRLSLHEPLLPLNIESNSSEGFAIILSQLRTFFKEFQFLDIKTLS